MTTQGLPNPPSRKSLDRKAAAYRANAEAHRRGEHADRHARLCKPCGDRKRAGR